MSITTRDYSAIAEAVSAVTARASSQRDHLQAVVDILWEHLYSAGVSWVGFYLVQRDRSEHRQLVLGPCRDKPACSPIGLHGVCGSGVVTGRIQIVEDIAELGDAYVACDPRDRSEIVIPLFDSSANVWAVLDLDSFEVGSFDEFDESGLNLVLQAAGLKLA